MGKGAHVTEMPGAHKRQAAALSPCPLCSVHFLAPCKVEEGVFGEGWVDLRNNSWSSEE